MLVESDHLKKQGHYGGIRRIGGDEIWSTPSGAENNLRLVVCKLCSPEKRLYEEAFSDLSITTLI
jgi:hypothetical protein